MTAPTELKAAREMIEANIVSGDVDDDTAVVNVAGLIGDIAESLSAQCAQPQAGGPVASFDDRWLGDGDSVHVLASPQPANPAQVTDAMVNAVLTWVCDDVLPAYDIPSDVPRNDPELPDSCRAALTAAIGAGGQAVAVVKESLHLTEYEVQVLLGTSIHGCNMSRDRVFSLDMAWHRFHTLDLIDRTDGLAIVTEKGEHVIATILSALSQPHPADERVVEALHNAKVLLKALTGPDDAIAQATLAGIDAALAKEGRQNG